jgi:hypothetical protein
MLEIQNEGHDTGRGESQNIQLSGHVLMLIGRNNYIPEEVLKEMEREGMSREQVSKLLSDMEMIDENEESDGETRMEVD